MLVEVTLKRWADIHRLVSNMPGYVFRGQANAQWTMATSLERCLSRYQPAVNIPENKEHWTLHEFKSKSHLYSSHRPDEYDNVEWLAVMQHYGCPTRLLDFSYSAYVAAYFAVVESDSDAAILALDEWALRANLRSQLALKYSPNNALRDEINVAHLLAANRFIGEKKHLPKVSALIPLVPKRLTDRIARQQGLFVMPTNASAPFMANLAAAYGHMDGAELAFTPTALKDFMGVVNPDSEDRPHVFKLVVPRSAQRDALESLAQMNITAETMFGGLDGLARSLLQTVIRS